VAEDVSCTSVKGIQLLDGVAAKAAQNKSYRRELLDNPKKVLTEAGLRVPKDIQIVVHVNTPDTVHLVLPAPAEKVSLREVNVTKLSAGLHF
jgi:hypothetical protein